jgi:AraC-like DNA-binding protein
MEETGIKQINLNDVPQLTHSIKYFDGDIGFADDIRSIIRLGDVFKVNFVAIVFCTSGSVALKINSVDYNINANDGLLINMQSVVSNIIYDRKMNCKIICISLDSGVTFMTKSVLDAFLRVRENPVVHFTKNEIELMSRYYELALFKMDHPEIGINSKESMHSILRAYILDMIANINIHYSDTNRKSMLRQSDKIFQNFIMLLAESNGTQRSVRQFADKLCVSPKYLTSICREKEGKTANELITLNTIGHIKQMLLYSSLSIKEISTMLGFPNISFFGKYVKKHMGLSPNYYRKANGYGK